MTEEEPKETPKEEPKETPKEKPSRERFPTEEEEIVVDPEKVRRTKR